MRQESSNNFVNKYVQNKQLFVFRAYDPKVYKDSEVDNPYQLVIKDDVIYLGEKITQGAGDLPNFTRISNVNKGKINHARINLLFLLTKMDRKVAKQDFFNLAFQAQLYDSENQFYEVKNDYPLKRNKDEIIKKYVAETYFYKTLNKGLKAFVSDPSQSVYLRLPFSDLFLSIKEEYYEQKNLGFSEIF